MLARRLLFPHTPPPDFPAPPLEHQALYEGVPKHNSFCPSWKPAFLYLQRVRLPEALLASPSGSSRPGGIYVLFVGRRQRHS